MILVVMLSVKLKFTHKKRIRKELPMILFLMLFLIFT